MYNVLYLVTLVSFVLIQLLWLQYEIYQHHTYIAGLPAIGNNASAGRSSHSTSIRYYHVISVGVICFLIGAITSFVVVIHCQRISPAAFAIDQKPVAASTAATAAAAAAAAVSPATKRRRRDVVVTSRGGAATTLQTVIRAASVCDEKVRRTSTSADDGDVFSPAARSSMSNGGCGGGQTALVHLRQYYRRHYTGGVADSNYGRT